MVDNKAKQKKMPIKCQGYDGTKCGTLYVGIKGTTYVMFLPPIWIPACNSSSPAFLMMCSAYKLNKQGHNIQPCHTPFSVLNQSVVPYKILNVAS